LHVWRERDRICLDRRLDHGVRDDRGLYWWLRDWLAHWLRFWSDHWGLWVLIWFSWLDGGRWLWGWRYLVGRVERVEIRAELCLVGVDFVEFFL